MKNVHEEAGVRSKFKLGAPSFQGLSCERTLFDYFNVFVNYILFITKKNTFHAFKNVRGERGY